jgi:hypothetical protein
MKSIIFLTSFISSISFSFTLNSSTNPNLEGWSGGDVQLLVNTANCPANIDVVGIIKDSVSIWNNVPTSSIKVSYGGSTTSTVASSPTTVYCETNFQAVVGADQNFVPGAASVSTTGGRISQGILYLNVSAGNANIANFDQTILKVILAHEIGHILGLGHSGSTNSLMYFDASARQKLSLSQDDIDGISYLYPSNEFSDSKFAGCGLVKNLPPPKGGGIILLMLILSLPILVSVRFRNLFKQSK